MRHLEGILEVLILMTFLYLSMFINDNNEIFYIKKKNKEWIWLKNLFNSSRINKWLDRLHRLMNK